MAAPESTAFRIKTRSPLSETTWKERRSLLVAGMIGIIIVKLGIVPAKISALGVELTPQNQESLKVVLSFVVFYFLICFVIQLILDVLGWTYTLASADWNVTYPFQSGLFNKKSLVMTVLISVRLLIEILLPIILGVYSLLLLWPGKENFLRFFHQ